MGRVRYLILILGLLVALPALSQDADKIEEQRRIVASLEKKIAEEERQISQLKQGKSASEERARRLARQLDSRKQLLEAQAKQARLLRRQMGQTDSVATSLNTSLERTQAQYAEMTREAYRNYRHNNYLTYIFSSESFSDVARRLTNLRAVAEMRRQKLTQIGELSTQVSHEKEKLTLRKRSLDAVTNKLQAQRNRLQRDAQSARDNIRQMSRKEKEALRRKVDKEQQLDVAINELRKLTKGNKEGDSFTWKTSGLHLPIAQGRVRKYMGNMAEIVGPQGAAVLSIYDGKVVDIKRNRITNKYDIYVAHGEYLTSYANLNSITIQKGSKVAKDQQMGTIGSSVDVITMETEYKIIFGIYAPSPGQTMRAENCFRK